ncbi:LOB domain-containing protein 1-like [Cryptomeria japonica]|uniref:LOB domain-containing protein 1-like n=1 Tax=Cryptomeria japonica TaxID=3369 RepID=UPI0027D9DDC2|nr:LOB domain-containing protein 1-like [Cryptomeria japonica]
MAPLACAACRFQRKKCSAQCLLAPHFPPDDLQRVMIVNQVYGISRVLKLLKDIEPEQRADAVNSLVYEASARVEDPVYGCTRATHQLQKRIADLESQLAATQAELLNMRFIAETPVYTLTTESHDAGHVLGSTSQQSEYTMCEKVDPTLLWEPLWQL